MVRSKSWSAKVGLLDRAGRFDIELPLRFRASGEHGWHEGKTENISSTGLLFRVSDLEALLDENTPLEMVFTAPAEVGGNGQTRILCRGNAVRTVMPAATDESLAVAAKITDYCVLDGPGN